MNKRSTSKLSYKLTLWVISISTIFTIISSSVLLTSTYKKRVIDFENHIIEIKKSNEKILELSIWHFDDIAIKGILEDIVDTKKVIYAQIVINDKTSYSKGIKRKKDILEKKFTLSKKNNGHIYKIGELYVQGDINYVKKEIRELFIDVILLELVKLFFLSLIIIFLVKKLFINNLEKLVEYTRNLHLANLNENLTLRKETKNPDELDLVVESFNKMRTNLLSEIEKSQKIKEELFAFRNAVENSFNSIVITDINRKIIYVNKVFEELTGYTKDEALNKNPNILKPKTANALYYKNMNEKLDNGETWDGELVNEKKDGTLFYEKASIIPIFIDEKLTNFLAIKLDITDYKESEYKINRLNSQLEKKVIQRTEELERTNTKLLENIEDLENTKVNLLDSQEMATKARKQAEDANREKSMFLANISHELKTPLNGINGLVYLARLRTENEDIHSNLDDISTYSETLLRMISDLLDTSKIDAKKIKIINNSFNLNKIINSIKQNYKIECKNKNVLFIPDISKSIPPKLIGDSIRIHQIITNLMNNAIKFTNTKEGVVKLIISCININLNEVRIEIEVSDNGIGIKENELTSIFNPFYQTENSLDHYAGGSGLGLSICKNIIEQMNGIIRVESELKKGSSFFVSLTLDIDNNLNNIERDKLAIRQANNKKYDEVLVLIVDDNTINLDVLEGILRSQKITCKLAKDGVEALELIKKFDFDLVLTDIKMPKMNGCELTNKVRKIYSLDELPIIVISANNQDAFDTCLEKCEINAFIQKPIDPEILIKKLSEYINLKRDEKVNKNEFIEINKVLDTEEALSRFVNNDKLYNRVLEDFLNDILNSSQKINSLLEKNKEAEVLDYLHSIKGLSANLSARSFSNITSKLHDTIKFGKDYSSLIIEFKEELNTLKDAINSHLQINNNMNEIEENSNLFDVKEKNTMLIELLKSTKSFNTKSINYFDSISNELRNDDLIQSLKNDIEQYKFKEASQKIESYLKDSNSFDI